MRFNTFSEEEKALYRDFYRWWTVGASRDHVKLGPLTLGWYRWTDNRMRVIVTFLMSREVVLFGGPL